MRTTEIEWDECCQFTNTKVELCELILTHTQCLQAMKPEQNEKKKKQDNECWWHDARCYTKTTHTWLIEIMQWVMFVTYLCPIEAHANSAENLSETNFYNDFFKKKKKRWKEITVWHWSIVQNIVIQPQMF